MKFSNLPSILIRRLAPLVVGVTTAFAASESVPPPGFSSLVRGGSLNGWWSTPAEDPRKVTALSPEEYGKIHDASLEGKDMTRAWRVEEGAIVNDGQSLHLSTDRYFSDYELLIDFKTSAIAEGGIWLKGCPKVQIWGQGRRGGAEAAAGQGSGGLSGNRPGAPGRDPLVRADRPSGQWNHFRIIQCGSRTWVWLNGKRVVDGAIFEDAFDPAHALPIPPAGPIQLASSIGYIRWRNIFVREIGTAEANRRLRGKDPEGFEPIFNGRNFDGWTGPLDNYQVTDGAIMCKPNQGGTIYTKRQYADFVARVEIKLPPGGNNGLSIRYPGYGEEAYDGMCELQVLDDSASKYIRHDPRQAHGSAYGMVASYEGYLRGVGEWNYEEVTVRGSTIKEELNGTVILDCDLSKVTKFMKHQPHPGKDRKSGSFGFAGHNDPVMFRNISIKPLP